MFRSGPGVNTLLGVVDHLVKGCYQLFKLLHRIGSDNVFVPADIAIDDKTVCHFLQLRKIFHPVSSLNLRH